MEEMKAKPYIEFFFDHPYKGFCGACGRIIFTGNNGSLEDVAKEIHVCRWCGCEVDWSDD